MAMTVTGKTNPDKGRKLRVSTPKLDRNKVLGLELPGCFFIHFALDSGN
jgi:hypothetical protein